MNVSVEATPCGPVPLLIGVTGHQDIDPALHEPLRAAVRAVFVQLSCDYPNSPLVLLSPLVAGADQLVADVVLDLATVTDINVQLVAVLPWPREWAVDDSSHADNLANSDRLLAMAKHVVTLPLNESITEELIRKDSDARNAQRDQGGRYIARHSQILIALWDGETSSHSHTYKVVEWQRSGGPAPFSAQVGELDMSEGAAVCHLPVNRTGAKPGSRVADEAVKPRWIYPKHEEPSYVRKRPKTWWPKCWFTVRSTLLSVHRLQHALAWWTHNKTPDGEQQLRERWRAMDRFNHDAARLPATAADKLCQSREYLIPEERVEELPECVRELRVAYALADISAGSYQTRIWWIVLALFGMGFTAVASLEIYAHYWHEWPIPLVYLVLLGVAYGVYRWSHRRQHQACWLDDRALAEALRVQVFWRWAGLNDCVADHYLRHFRGQLDWIRHATRAVFLISGGHAVEQPVSPNEQHDRFELARKHWVKDQHDYFKGKAPLNTELEICFETAAKLLFYAAIAVTVYLIWHHIQTHHMSHALVLATFGCLVVAALLEEFAEIQTYALLARRYRWMTDLFANALRRMDNLLAESSTESQCAEHIHDVFFDLGREALAENADWVIQHRQRPPILPKG